MFVRVNGKEILIEWMWLIEHTGELIMQYEDERPLSQIAAEWEGIELFERISEAEGDKVYKGFTQIRRIARKNNITPKRVEIVFVKG